VRHLVEYGTKNGKAPDSPYAVFTCAFATHAVLDRLTHPYINFFSGWVSPRHPESDQYYNCHAFFERIIDVFVLRIRGGKSIDGYDFFSMVDCGPEMPLELADSLSKGIVAAFPEYTSAQKVRRRLENAYFDTRNFYIFTNPADLANLYSAFIHEKGRGKTPRRLLALFHPRKLPDLDYLNGARAAWNHPGMADDVHHETFFELYDRAVEVAVPVVRAVKDAFDGNLSGIELEAVVGNENLSDGRPKKVRRRLELVRPLPLQEVLRTFYIDVEKSITSGSA
jgi:hypothetical protein